MTDIVPTTAQAAPLPPPQAAPTAAETPPPPSRATFDVLPLSREVRETLAEIGYTHPTPVQIAVWEPATRGKDAVVQARTGTGKTAAFGLPIVDHLVRRSMPQVQVLALCPTRELALQVATEVERLGKKKNVKVTAIYGGAPMQRQIDQLADGTQVVVGTPGRVLDHLRRGTLDPRHVRMLVLDESDEMLSMGFEREVTAILDTLPKDRQTLLFSATLPPDIERMAKKLRSPEYLTLSGDHVGALEIEHFVYMCAGDKLAALVKVIEVENPEGAVVFCNTKDETERVAQTLCRQGFDADWLNGDLPQSDREKVMSATREGRLRFLVATDVAARGIDISHLTHVINHDFPQDAESYVHRTGRTGRAGRTGTAISLITPQDIGGLYLLRLTYKIRPIERQIPSEGELKTRAEADLVSMLVEAFMPTADGGRSRSPAIHPDDLALARRLLTHEQCDFIFAGLLRDHLGARPTVKQEASAARRATRAPLPAPRPRAEAPAPRAHVEAPAPRAHVEAPAPRAHVEAPAPRAHVEAPAPRAHVEAPAPRAHVEAPAPRAHVEAPPLAPRPPAMPLPRAQADAPLAPPAAPRPRFDAAPARPDAPLEPARPFDAQRPERRPDDRRGRDGRGDRDDNRRGPRPEAGLSPRRPRPQDHVPVSAAEGSHEGTADPRNVPQRHADFSTWQPAAEEGDDEPILGAGPDEAQVRGSVPMGEPQRPQRRFEREGRGDRDRPRRAPSHDGAAVHDPRPKPRAPGEPFAAPDAGLRPASGEGARPAQEGGSRAPFATGEGQRPAPQPFTPGEPQRAASQPGAAGEPPVSSEPEVDGDFAEIYVNVGRRDGARAADFQQILTDRAGLLRAHVRRIRVRERNAFVSVRRDDLVRALAALGGASIAGKVAMAEQARDRGAEGEGAPDAAAPAATPHEGSSQEGSLREGSLREGSPHEGSPHEAPPAAAPEGSPQAAHERVTSDPHAAVPPSVEEEGVPTPPVAFAAPHPAVEATAPPAPISSDESVPTGRSRS